MNSAQFQDTKVINTFQSTNNKQLEKEIKNKISFTIAAKGMQIKTTMRYYLMPTGIPYYQKDEVTCVCVDNPERALLCTADGTIN